MRLAPWQQQNVALFQRYWWCTTKALQHRPATQYDMVRDLAGLAAFGRKPPGHAVLAATIEYAAHRQHLEQTAQPIHDRVDRSVRRTGISSSTSDIIIPPPPSYVPRNGHGPCRRGQLEARIEPWIA